MTDEKPTADGGASISERFTALLARESQPESQPEASSAPAQEPAAGEETPAVEEAPAGDATDEVEGPQFELSDVAKVLGLDESILDVDEDGSLKIKTKVGEQEGTAKLQDLIKSYQLQGHVDAKSRQLAEAQRAHAEWESQAKSFAQTKLSELEAMGNAAFQMLGMEQVDWDRLMAEDPLGFSQKQYEYQKRQQQIGQFLQAVNQQKAQIGQALAAQQQREMASEAQRLSEFIPEWKDGNAMVSGMQELHDWMKSQGANPARGLADAGVVALLRAAMVAGKTAPKVAAVEKKVRSAPKLVKPGQPVDARQRADESVRGLRENLKKTGKGFAELLIATGKV